MAKTIDDLTIKNRVCIIYYLLYINNIIYSINMNYIRNYKMKLIIIWNK
jgi:hypothetical protein